MNPKIKKIIAREGFAFFLIGLAISLTSWGFYHLISDVRVISKVLFDSNIPTWILLKVFMVTFRLGFIVWALYPITLAYRIRCERDKKFNSLGLLLFIVHSTIAVVVACFIILDIRIWTYSYEFLRIMDIPVEYIVTTLSRLIYGVFKIYSFSPFYLTIALYLILGGLQWYFSGWVISHMISKIKEQFE